MALRRLSAALWRMIKPWPSLWVSREWLAAQQPAVPSEHFSHATAACDYVE